MCRGLRQPREDLQGTGEIKLRQLRKDDKADIEDRHGCFPAVANRERNSVGDTAIVRVKARSMRRNEPNPQWNAMLSTVSSVSISARRAMSMRTRSTKSAGLTSRLARNRRLSERNETPASAASTSVDQSVVGFSVTFSASRLILGWFDDWAASSDENWLCPPGRIRKTTWRRATASATSRPWSASIIAS